MLVYPKEDSVIIADTVADEGIAACRPGSQYVPLGQLNCSSSNVEAVMVMRRFM